MTNLNTKKLENESVHKELEKTLRDFAEHAKHYSILKHCSVTLLQ